MKSILFVAAALLCLLGSNVEGAKKRHGSVRSSNSFDYYLLVLSYAPDFCYEPGGNKDPLECGPGRKLGFVVHGLWPQAETGRGPQNCGGSPVSGSIVQLMLRYMPSASLIQHEWSSHGTCTGLDANAYFAQVRKARDSVTIPSDLAQPNHDLTLNPSQIEQEFGAANPSLGKQAFRTACYADSELQDVRVCLTKDLTARACPTSVPDCRQSNVLLKPVR